MDFSTGLICVLTGQIANFENECENFILDEKYQGSKYGQDIGLQREELEKKLPKEIFEKLLKRQNLPLGILSSIVSGIICAFIWGKITFETHFQIGLMPIIVGAVVGIVMRFTGQGIERKFGVWGAIIAVLSCVLGNFFSIILFVGNSDGLGFFETLFFFRYSLLPSLMADTFHIIDILFYFIALAEGYRFSIRYISENTFNKL